MRPRRRKTPKSGIRPAPRIRSPQHLQWVRGHECAARDHSCLGALEAAHVRSQTNGGMGVKPSDTYAIPLCSWHHREQHNIGEKQFEVRHKIKMLEIAEDLARRSPHRTKWKA